MTTMTGKNLLAHEEQEETLQKVPRRGVDHHPIHSNLKRRRLCYLAEDHVICC